MAENYFGKCAMCEYFDLRDKSLGKYYCTKRKTYFTVYEKQCTAYFKPAGGEGDYTRSELVDRAREGKL